MWRRRRNQPDFDDPMLIGTFWPEMKNGVDAVYEDKDTEHIVFFKGTLQSTARQM